MKLRGRSAIITGANQGFGLEVARAFVKEGANVVICARNKKMLLEAEKELQELAASGTCETPQLADSCGVTESNTVIKIIAIEADVSKPGDISALVEKALTELPGIDILVANAGVYGTKGSLETIDWDEWSYAIDINLKGTVMVCRAILPHFKQKHYGKIILLSGGGATKPMPYLSAYAASKAAVVRFGETLAEEVTSYNIDVNSIAPGPLNTRLLDEVLVAGPEKVGESFYQQSMQQKQSGGASFEKGAALCTFLASAASDGITGRLISAIWDPWQDFSKRWDEIKNSDIYTLRRIVPKDRGKAWGE